MNGMLKGILIFAACLMMGAVTQAADAQAITKFTIAKCTGSGSPTCNGHSYPEGVTELYCELGPLWVPKFKIHSYNTSNSCDEKTGVDGVEPYYRVCGSLKTYCKGKYHITYPKSLTHR
ncbi:hypothetical protein [Coxiella burnetii]|uniref:Uncharacterized protein n=2 Tax=Coxiella burnetii TaxID=777 RepID=B5QS96_COXBU|nr:hypothetical protein [Coxiella burnetii]YP_002332969.1 hypothetical protein CBU_0516a [Coxiella burnetii RSA 493]ACI15260.1 hypothetical protein CBU_0516a [Coxiella burnetii RSA 493]ACI23184.1 hypothetical protein CBUD_1558a [Coxiella burnetii Dugway 5J108-111]ARI65393.1 hypothetical protein B7L74_02675 [Coxiella burnetii]ARK26872.1 hypothetical protein BMW92_02600 [Coxiella burnetii]MCF2093338.1 hypothetical protein [Coxiella burnetii]